MFSVDETITINVYVGTSAQTVPYVVYDEANGSFDTGNMAEIGSTGIYTQDFTPDAAGYWTFACSVVALGFRYGAMYPVEVGDIDQLLNDWEDGGRLDVILDGRAPAGEYDTELDANMSTRAPSGEYDTEMAYLTEAAATEAKQDTMQGNVTDILEDTATTIPALLAATKAGKLQIFEKSITAALDAGVTTVGTITTQPCLIESVVIHADAAPHADMTTCAVEGGVDQVVTFIGTDDATEANLSVADKQVGWTGAVRFAATKVITIDLQGVGANAADLTVIIGYRACADGGYIT